MQWSSA